jgi:hypothetical protein
MGTSIFPAVQSPIKSIQRGSFASAGSITISSINTSKSFIKSFSNGSGGAVSLSGSESGQLNPTGGSIAGPSGGGNAVAGGGTFANYFGTRTFSGGTTAITVQEYGAYIVNSTTITATGACRYEVVEYL